MKIKQLLVFATMFLTACASKSLGVITNPSCRYSTGSIAINSIELSSDKTVLNMDLYGLPNNWVKMASTTVLKSKTNEGRVYAMTSCNGITPDEEFYLDQSGHLAVSLEFEPLDKGDESVDFYESEEWQIYDIDLTGRNKTPRGKIHCKVEGTVVDRPYSNRIVYGPAGFDPRINGNYVSINDGKFSFAVDTDYPQAYELIFIDELQRGSWRPIVVFVEKGRVNLELYSEDEGMEKNKIRGGKWNSEYFKVVCEPSNEMCQNETYKKYQQVIESHESMYSDEYEVLMDQINASKDQNERSKLIERINTMENVFKPEFQTLLNEVDELSKRFDEQELEYIKANVSPVTIYLLSSLLAAEINYDGANAAEHIDELIDLYESTYADKLKGSPYHDVIRLAIEAQNVCVGGKFIDFSASDTNGTTHTLSQEIAGKYALIDLWASWCGPCIRSAIEMVPVYEKYKDKGFTIVGVARENGSIMAMQKIISENNFSWLNLVEMNDYGHIWEKYGVGNAGGATFLVDDKGTILAVKPSAEEVEEILKENL